MVKDYKITTNVNKEAYLVVRGKLLLEGRTFSDWLEEKLMKEDVLDINISKDTKVPKSDIDNIQQTIKEAQEIKAEMTKPLIPQLDTLQFASSLPIRGGCKNCGFLKLVSPHTFIYQEERITDNLCDACWKKALQNGSARDE